MARTTQNSGKVQRRTAIGFIALMGLLAPSLPAAAAPYADPVIVLEGATAAEGIAAGDGTTFYAGDRLEGDIYRGDIRDGEAGLFIDAPDGRQAIGMKFDSRNNLLFVAGGSTGTAYVYDTGTGGTVAVLDLAPGFINDVTLTPEGAWFTNSLAGFLYFIPVGPTGELGDVQSLELSGPAADTSSGFNLNGIASVEGGNTLIVAHSGNGELYTVDPDTGESALIEGVSVPNVDGILVQGHQVWAVQNFSNQISRVRLSGDLSSGTVVEVIQNEDLFSTPTTAALFGSTLAVVNAKFAEPTATEFEVVLVPAR